MSWRLFGVFLCASLLASNLLAQDDSTVYFMPISGQSKAGAMKNFNGDKESGASELERVVSESTGHKSYVLMKDSLTQKTVTPATGGATMDGDNAGDRPPKKIFWYPDANKAGIAANYMLAVIKSQHKYLLEKEAAPIRIMIPWMQGESNISAVASAQDSALATARYKQATKALFDYVERELGVNVEFFIVLTGFPDAIGMENRGWSESLKHRTNLATVLVRSAQKELIAENDNIHYGGDTDGLETVREADPEGKPEDVWHLSSEACEDAGRMMGGFIAKHVQ